MITKLLQHSWLSLATATVSRLGFLGRDDNATIFVTAKGLGYLLDVVAAERTTLQEAYAAGYDQGYVQARERF